MRHPSLVLLPVLLALFAACSGAPAVPAGSPGNIATAPATGEPSPTADLTWDADATAYRDRVGQRFVFRCVPNGEPDTVWGTDVYTDDSSVCTAAVHAGLLTLAGGGIVIVEILPGQGAYTGSERNGIRTLEYGAWDGSFRFVR